MLNTLLFPSDIFNRKVVDEDMKPEFEAALETGRFELLLFSYNDWFSSGRLVLSHIPNQETEAVYHGWMMKPEQYADFYD